MVGSVTIEPYGTVAEIAFWPVILLLSFLAWRFRAYKVVVVGCVLSLIAIFVVGTGHDYIHSNTSLATAHDLAIGECIISGIFFLLFTAMTLQIASEGWPKGNRILALFVIAVSLASLWAFVAGIVGLVRDMVWPWYTVEGEVTYLHRTAGLVSWKFVGPNIVRIGDRQLIASERVYKTLRVGQRVRAQVSSGSDFIRQLERIR